MVYGQPSYAVATLFRPFLWGYLLLGAERGLAFFWDARMLCMMLVGFEFSRLLSKDDGLCALGSLMCTLSPATQWWFAVNGAAELLIFGEGLVLTLHSLLNAETGRGRWGMSAILAWLCGSYLLILYPAWQVPFFWIFLALGIWVCVEWAKRTDGDKRHKQMRSICTPLIVCVAAVVLLLLAYVLWYSKDTVAAVMGSVYPGARNERGGGLLQLLPKLTTSIAGPSLQLPSPIYASLQRTWPWLLWALSLPSRMVWSESVMASRLRSWCPMQCFSGMASLAFPRFLPS